MKLGEIYYWNTDRAKGHDHRFKYHLYIGECTWKWEGEAFLFINKSKYGDDYTISKNDYPFFELDVSYIGCSDIVVYPNDEMAKFAPVLIGRLKDNHLKELYGVVSKSFTMAGWQINFVCNILKVFI